MKILLDESIPRKLRLAFGLEHEVWTVRDKGWQSKKNGELLALMTTGGFDIFVTVDKNLQYQQNLTRFSVTIVVLVAVDNRLQTLQLLVPRIFERLSKGNFQNVIEIS